jgi:uncharacterized protein YqgV (UPF0045/DUF77 family)
MQALDNQEASIAIQVLPQGLEGDAVIRVVDEVIAHIKASGLNTFVGPFETTVEGGFEQLMRLLRECQLIAVQAGASGVMSYVKIAFRPGEGVWSIEKKVRKHMD